MGNGTQKQFPVGMVICTVLVVVASFMPWGSIRASSPSFFGMRNVHLTATAWNGNLTVFGLTIPNWLTVVAAIATALFAILRGTGAWPAPKAALVLPAAYGVAHSGMSVFLFVTQAKLGIGSPLTLLAFVAMLVIAIRTGKPAHPQTSADSDG